MESACLANPTNLSVEETSEPLGVDLHHHLVLTYFNTTWALTSYCSGPCCCVAALLFKGATSAFIKKPAEIFSEFRDKKKEGTCVNLKSNFSD